MDTHKVEEVFRKMTKSKWVHEGVLFIENLSGDLSYTQSYGDRTVESPMLTASISKLFTTTCILALMEQGRVALADPLIQYIKKEKLKGIQVYKGKDYVCELTVEHLLFQTSGLPDFYLESGGDIFKKVITEDFSYTFEETLNWIRGMQPHFAPGTKGKAYYTDVNFDLLGKVIEAVNGSTLQEAYHQYIFKPLNLRQTYLATQAKDLVPHTYYKAQRLERPAFIRSCYASGGCVTTAKELMIFIKAFWSGQLFNKQLLSRLDACKPLQLAFYPICYGGGYMQMDVGFPFGKKTRLVGHSGSTGSFAYYCPEKELFLVGDVPQIAGRNIGGKLLAFTVLNLR